MYIPLGARYPTVELTARDCWPVAGSVRPPSMPLRLPELACQPSGSFGSRIGIFRASASACSAAGAS